MLKERAKLIVGKARAPVEKDTQQNEFVDYAVYESNMLSRRKALLKLYTDELYQAKEDLAKIGYDLVIEKGRWKHDI